MPRRKARPRKPSPPSRGASFTLTRAALCLLACAAAITLLRAAAPRRHAASQNAETANAQTPCAAAAQVSLEEARRLRATWKLEERRRALAKYEEARRCFRDAGDARGEASALKEIGDTYFTLAERERARESFEQALALWKRTEDRGAEAETLAALGLSKAYLGRGDEAVADCEAALTLSRKLGDARREAKSLVALGQVYSQLSRPPDARKALEAALPVAEAAGDAETRAQCLLSLGYVRTDAGELDAALDAYKTALALWQSARNLQGEARTLTAIGGVHTLRGERQLALEHHRRALELSRGMGDLLAQAVTLNGIGAVYSELGDQERALRSFLEALADFTALGHQRGRALGLQYVGNTYASLGETRKARGYYEQALALSRKLGDEVLEAYGLNNLGVVLQSAGDSASAVENFRRALSIYERVGNRRGRAYALVNIGYALEREGSRAPALEHYARALELLSASADRAGELLARHSIARVERDAGRLDEARAQCEATLNLVESLRTKVAAQDLRTSFFATARQHYELYIDILMRLERERPLQGFAAAALGASERARARTLLEALAEVRAGIRRGVDPSLLERRRALEQRTEESARRLSQIAEGDAAKREAAAREFDDLRRESEELKAEIRSSSPRYAALAEPQPLGLEEIQRDVLDADTVLLEYSLGEERSYLWVVARDSLASYELPPRAEIEGRARRLFELLTARQAAPGESFAERQRRAAAADADYSREAAALARAVLDPAAPHLGDRRLLVVAEGTLQLIPFAALPAVNPAQPRSQDSSPDAEPLGLSHEIVSLPSASTLALLRREGASSRAGSAGTVAVFADPVYGHDDARLAASGAPETAAASRGEYERLPATREEADAIASVVPAGSVLKVAGFGASREAALDPRLAGYRVVHFATHAVFDESRPDLSHVALSLFDERGGAREGHLRLHDIYNLDLPVELVVLSACNTARGREVPGEGLVGLTRGFMYAGASSVLASLWKVDDDATAEFMRRFYRAMFAEGRTPAAALREARAGMWRERRWRAPYYWAAFVLQGEYRGDVGRAAAAASPPPPRASRRVIVVGVASLLALAAVCVYAVRRRRRAVARAVGG